MRGPRCRSLCHPWDWYSTYRDGGFIYFFNGKLEGKYTSPIAHGCFFGMCCDLVVVIKVAMGSVWFEIFFRPWIEWGKMLNTITGA